MVGGIVHAPDHPQPPPGALRDSQRILYSLLRGDPPHEEPAAGDGRAGRDAGHRHAVQYHPAFADPGPPGAGHGPGHRHHRGLAGGSGGRLHNPVQDGRQVQGVEDPTVRLAEQLEGRGVEGVIVDQVEIGRPAAHLVGDAQEGQPLPLLVRGVARIGPAEGCGSHQRRVDAQGHDLRAWHSRPVGREESHRLAPPGELTGQVEEQRLAAAEEGLGDGGDEWGHQGDAQRAANHSICSLQRSRATFTPRAAKGITGRRVRRK